MRRSIVTLALLAMTGPATLAWAQDAGEVVPDSVTPERVLAGSAIYNGGTCAFCHAVAGRGSGRWAPDLSDVEWLHSEGDFEGIWKTIFWGVEEDEFKASSPRRWPMNPEGGMSLDWAQVRDLAAYVWTISRPSTHPFVLAQSRFLD